MQIASGPSSYSLYFDGVLVAADIPLLSTSGFVGLTTSQSAAEFKDISVYALDAPPDGSDLGGEAASKPLESSIVAPPVADGRQTSSVTDDLPDLETISGLWVQEPDGRILQKSSEPVDHTLGTGIAAENYRFEVTIGFDDVAAEDAAAEDAGEGILFHMPSRNDVSGAHMVRFVNAGQGITWGYFDDDARYIGQGYADLSREARRGSTLQLIVEGGSYDLLVDGVLLVDEMATRRGSGWIALTSYRGPVDFKEIQLSLGSVIQ